MELPLDKVRKVLKIAKEPISLETPIGEEEDSHLGDFIEDKAIVSPVRRGHQHEPGASRRGRCSRRSRRARRRSSACASASARRRDHTLEEVGQDFEVTRERIRQIEAKALRKLRHPTPVEAAQELRRELAESMVDGARHQGGRAHSSTVRAVGS